MNLILKIITYNDIVSYNPCIPASTYFQPTWIGTAVDVLNLNQIPVIMRLWVVMRDVLLSQQQQRLFAVFCANQRTQTDQRCIDAINTAIDLANSQCTEAKRYAAEYSAALAVQDSSDATETATRMAAMHCVISNLYAAVLGTADLSAANSDSNAQDQITQAISIFQQYGY